MKRIIQCSTIAAVACLGFVGCSETVDPVKAESQYSLGSRALPGCGIEVVQFGEATPNGSCAFVVRLTSEAATDCTVEARVGTVYEEQADFVSMSRQEDGEYKSRLALPEDLSGVRVFVKAIYDDGSVVESGSDDFGIAIDQ